MQTSQRSGKSGGPKSLNPVSARAASRTALRVKTTGCAAVASSALRCIALRTGFSRSVISIVSVMFKQSPAGSSTRVCSVNRKEGGRDVVCVGSFFVTLANAPAFRRANEGVAIPQPHEHHLFLAILLL